MIRKGLIAALAAVLLVSGTPMSAQAVQMNAAEGEHLTNETSLQEIAGEEVMAREMAEYASGEEATPDSFWGNLDPERIAEMEAWSAEKHAEREKTTGDKMSEEKCLGQEAIADIKETAWKENAGNSDIDTLAGTDIPGIEELEEESIYVEGTTQMQSWPEDVEIVSVEDADVQSAEGFTYTVTCDAPTNNYIYCDVVITGYTSYSDFSKSVFDIYVFEGEDVLNFGKMSKSVSSGTVDGVYTVTVRGAYKGEPNKTYSVRPMYFDSESNKNVTVCDPITVTTGAERALQYNMTCQNTEGSVLEMRMEVKGYKNSTDYSLTGKPERFLISATEDFASYEAVYYGTGSTNLNGEYIRTATAIFLGEGNTTYYIKPGYYDSATGKSYPAGEVMSVTTGEKTVLGASLKRKASGAAYASFDFQLTGAGENVVEKYMKLQYSTDETFEKATVTSLYCDEKLEDGSYIGDVNISGLIPEGTYYVRLVQQVTENDAVTYIPMTEPITITMEADVEYEDSCFPDEVFRNYLKSSAGIDKVGKLTKSRLERITQIKCEREGISEPVIKSIAGIELVPRLTYVDLEYNEVADISPLAKLPFLETAYLEHNKLTTLPDLSGLSNLKTFYVYYNYIPEKEFVASKLPANFLAKNKLWLDDNMATQRIDDTLGIVTADTYYSTAVGVYPLQVEITNIYLLSEYTLDIYEGETLLVENLEAKKTASYYSTESYLVEDIADVEGSKTFTFVVKADGAEVMRTTRTVQFKEQLVYDEYAGMYAEADEISPYVDAKCVGATTKVTKAELLDTDGNVLYIKENPSSSTSSGMDYRYENLFVNNCITHKYTTFYYYIYLKELLPPGSYDMRLTLADETVILAKDALVVTEHSVISEIEVLDYEYPGSVDGEYAYIGVAGLNMNWDRLGPVVYDRDGNIMSKVVEYRLQYDDAAIYKVRNISGKSWVEAEEVGIWHQPADVFLNDRKTSFDLYSGAEIELAQHMASSGKVFVLCSNMEDGVEYTWELYKSNKKDEGVVTCTGALKNGMAELSFANEDGSAFVFDPEQSYYTVDCTSMDTVSYSFYNEGKGSLYTPKYDATEYITYVNNGQTYIGTHIVNASAIGKDAKVELVVLDGARKEVENPGTVTKELTFVQNAVRPEKVWELTVDLSGVEWVNDRQYTYYVEVDGNVVLTEYVFVLDPEKLYGDVTYADYKEDTKELEVRLTGYFPASLDDSLFGIKARVSSEAPVFTGENCTVTRTGRYAGTCKEEVWLKCNLSQMADAIIEKENVYFITTYNGEHLRDTGFYTYWQQEITWDTDYAEFCGERGDYSKYPICGVERERGRAVKVYFYEVYDTTPVAAIDIPAGDDLYEFTAKDVQNLVINRYDRPYYMVLTDSEGNYLNSEWDYVGGMWPFVDVTPDKSNWQYAGINYAYGSGVMSGTSIHNFEPNKQLTREMLVQMLYSLEGKPAVEYKDTFSDVTAGQWYSNAVIWAAENGITSGLGDGSFGVNEPITREQLALMLYQYAVKKSYDVSGAAAIDSFVDKANVSTWSATSVQWAVAQGIISGKPVDAGMKLDPQGNATRAECAAMMRKFCLTYVE